MKYIAIWQSEQNVERHFVRRLFEPYISEHVVDGRHEVVRDNAILFDAWVFANDPAYYAAFAGKNAFLFHLSDEFYELGVDRYVHFRGVFRAYWSSVFNPRFVKVVPLGVSSVATTGRIIPASERLYAWSFVGDGDKCSRPEVLRHMAPVEPHLAFSTSDVRGFQFWNKAKTSTKRIARSRFMEILGDSAFAPAPMGNVNLESFRVYEALEAGAIPIVERRLSLDYFKHLLGDHPIPTVRSWSQAQRLVYRLLQEPVHLDALQRDCFEWWKAYQSMLIQEIGSFLAERSGSNEPLVPLKSRWALFPAWQYCELARHHALKALMRRIFRQFARLVRQGRWRISFTK